MHQDGGIPPARNGSYPLRRGNRIRPLIDGEPAFHRICEAVEAAECSVWVTVAFVERDVSMPGGRGGFFDVLDHARTRGLDVRVLFWRMPELEENSPGAHFPGTETQHIWLRQRGSRFLARWDRLPYPYCHHQKSWLVDAGRPTETVFVGGINLDPPSIVSPGHAPAESGSVHDVYVELEGPAATDVHHNFVQRWNGATERDRSDGVWPGPAVNDDLPWPESLSPERGDAPAQITRTVRRKVYDDGHPSPGAERFPIDAGEKSILEQYVSMIEAARETLYFENQAIASSQILGPLEEALRRGVEVAFVVPGRAHEDFVRSRRDLRFAPFFEQLGGLGRYENFTLAGLASNLEQGDYLDVYVHAKIALADDEWATIGSTNIVNRSFHGDTELNASFWDRPTVLELRRRLLEEHVGVDTGNLVGPAALRLFREVATENAARRRRRAPLECLAFRIDPATYGEE